MSHQGVEIRFAIACTCRDVINKLADHLLLGMHELPGIQRQRRLKSNKPVVAQQRVTHSRYRGGHIYEIPWYTNCPVFHAAPNRL